MILTSTKSDPTRLSRHIDDLTTSDYIRFREPSRPLCHLPAVLSPSSSILMRGYPPRSVEGPNEHLYWCSSRSLALSRCSCESLQHCHAALHAPLIRKLLSPTLLQPIRMIRRHGRHEMHVLLATGDILLKVVLRLTLDLMLMRCMILIRRHGLLFVRRT